MGVVKDAPKGGRPKNGAESASYSEQAAASLGVSQRAVQQDLRRGKNIAPDVLAEIAGTDMDKGVVLDALAGVPQADQRAKLAEITLRRQEAERMRKEAETANRDTDRVIALTDAEQFANWIIARAELTDAQRADHHVRREAILVRMGEVSKGRGGDQTDKLSVRSYAKKAAADLGVDERTIRRDLRRGKNIDADVLAEVTGPPSRVALFLCAG